jgi:hypothetical protein
VSTGAPDFESVIEPVKVVGTVTFTSRADVNANGAVENEMFTDPASGCFPNGASVAL